MMSDNMPRPDEATIVLLNHLEYLMDEGILPDNAIPVKIWNAVSCPSDRQIDRAEGLIMGVGDRLPAEYVEGYLQAIEHIRAGRSLTNGTFVSDTDRIDWLEARGMIDPQFHNIDRITSVQGKFNGLPSLRAAIDQAQAHEAEQVRKIPEWPIVGDGFADGIVGGD